MLASIAASAAAARAIGYAGLGDLIEADGLGPEQIAALLHLSCCKRAARDYAVIILAASIGRYRACPKGWIADPEKGIAMEILKGEADPQAVFLRLSEKASRIVKQHWVEIASAA